MAEPELIQKSCPYLPHFHPYSVDMEAGTGLNTYLYPIPFCWTKLRLGRRSSLPKVLQQVTEANSLSPALTGSKAEI